MSCSANETVNFWHEASISIISDPIFQKNQTLTIKKFQKSQWLRNAYLVNQSSYQAAQYHKITLSFRVFFVTSCLFKLVQYEDRYLELCRTALTHWDSLFYNLFRLQCFQMSKRRADLSFICYL